MANSQLSGLLLRAAALLASITLAACNGGGGSTKGTATKVNPRSQNNKSLSGQPGGDGTAFERDSLRAGNGKAAQTGGAASVDQADGQKAEPSSVPKELIAREDHAPSGSAKGTKESSGGGRVYDVTDQVRLKNAQVGPAAEASSGSRVGRSRAEAGVPLIASPSQNIPPRPMIEDLFREAGLDPRITNYGNSSRDRSASAQKNNVEPEAAVRQARRANERATESSWPSNAQPASQPTLTGAITEIQGQHRMPVDAAGDSVMLAITDAVNKMSEADRQGSFQLADLIDEINVQAQPGLVGLTLRLVSHETTINLHYSYGGSFSNNRVANLVPTNASSNELDIRVKATCVDRVIRNNVCQVVVLTIEQWIDKLCRRAFAVHRFHSEDAGRAHLVMTNEADYNFWINYENRSWQDVVKAYPSASQRAFLRMMANTVYNNKIKRGELSGEYRKPYFRFSGLRSNSVAYGKSWVSLILEKTNNDAGAEKQLGQRTQIWGQLAASVYNGGTTDRRESDLIYTVETKLTGDGRSEADDRFNDRFTSSDPSDSIEVAKMLFTDGQGKFTFDLKFRVRRLVEAYINPDQKPDFQFNVVNLNEATLSYAELQNFLTN